ncbi:TerB family tellurite resistance protein [Trinickia sp. YCB016]
MRQYRNDSSYAAARIIEICLLADGYVGRRELNTLEKDGMCALLALRPSELLVVMQSTRDDLASTAYSNWKIACRMEPRLLHELAAEIQDASLRLKIVEFCEACLRIGRHTSHGKAAVLRGLSEAWQVPDECAWVRHCDGPRLAFVLRPIT